MGLAHHLADWSKETGQRVGAVIVGPDQEIRSTGFNGFPCGVDDDVEARHDKVSGAKYLWSTHAEANAIYNAARIGIPLNRCVIYIPWFPCVECSKAIIQSGICEVVAYEPDDSDARWSAQFRIAETMFSEAGVTLRYMDKLTDLPTGA